MSALDRETPLLIIIFTNGKTDIVQCSPFDLSSQPPQWRVTRRLAFVESYASSSRQLTVQTNDQIPQDFQNVRMTYEYLAAHREDYFILEEISVFKSNGGKLILLGFRRLLSIKLKASKLLLEFLIESM